MSVHPQQKYPSIFNDVIGPVMRGPSSSHCAASLRIGRLCRDLMGGEIVRVLIEFDPNGSLATTHDGQGSDMGLFGGFLGWEAHDHRLVDSEDHLRGAGVDFEIVITDIAANHPNTYQITLWNSERSHQVIALSTGGGMIEIISVDGNEVSIEGDFFQTLIFAETPSEFIEKIESQANFEHIRVCDSFIEVKSVEPLDLNLVAQLRDQNGVTEIQQLNTVLPIKSRKGLSVPFISVEEMLDWNQDKNLSLWELAIQYEKVRGDISESRVIHLMGEIVDIMTQSIHSGLEGTQFADRILGPQSTQFKKELESGNLLQGDLSNRVIMYVSAMMEVKSSMGVIVAAPTAGSCGTLPGTLIGAGEFMKKSREEIIKAMLCSAMIGTFIAAHATFAAEVGGCQAETGAGGTMAAAGLVYMGGGNLKQSLAASSMAMQNSLGIVCDPIANRVEAPCLGKNVMAAMNAISSTNMALANYDQVIPLDEVIDAMDSVGKSMDSSLRCTGFGGLAITKTAKEIESKLADGRMVPIGGC